MGQALRSLHYLQDSPVSFLLDAANNNSYNNNNNGDGVADEDSEDRSSNSNALLWKTDEVVSDIHVW